MIKSSKFLGIVLLVIGGFALIGVIFRNYDFITISNTILSLLFIFVGVKMISRTHGENCQCSMCKYSKKVENKIDNMSKGDHFDSELD